MSFSDIPPATLMLTAGQPVHEVARYLGPQPTALLTSDSHVLRGRQEHVGYTGDYESWIRKVTPPDLE